MLYLKVLEMNGLIGGEPRGKNSTITTKQIDIFPIPVHGIILKSI